MSINANKIPVELIEKVFHEMRDTIITLNHAQWKIISVNPKKKTLSLELQSVEMPEHDH